MVQGVVVEDGAADVDHAEQQQKKDGRHQGELDQGLRPLPFVTQAGRQLPCTAMCTLVATWKTPNWERTIGVSGPYV